MDMDDIRNLEDLLRIVFILNYSLTMESLLEILTKSKSQGEHLFNKHVEHCESVR